MTESTIVQGEKVDYTDADGRRRGARVDYVWERGDGTPNPLVNLSFMRDGEDRRTVATSVPHRSEVEGASGYYWERQEPARHYVEVRGEPGDVVSFLNLTNGYTQSFRLAHPPPEFKRM